MSPYFQIKDRFFQRYECLLAGNFKKTHQKLFFGVIPIR